MFSSRTLALYLLCLASFLVFFLIGLRLGQQQVPSPVAGPAAAPPEDVEAVQAELDEYDDLLEESRSPDLSPPSVVREKPQVEIVPRQEPPQAETPSPPPPTASPEGVRNGLYTVQVAALTSEGECTPILQRLEAKGYAGRIQPPAQQGGYYRVWVGEFATRQQALEVEARLKADGFPTYVRRIP